MKLLCWALLLFTTSSFANVMSSPIGLWKTVDDVTGESKSIVQISMTPEHRLAGKIVKLFHDPSRVCVACKGAEHNQPIVGMNIIRGLKQDSDHPFLWSDGYILDPKNGKEYRCQIHLSESGQVLQVKGYIGTPLFGRSQSWNRVNGQ